MPLFSSASVRKLLLFLLINLVLLQCKKANEPTIPTPAVLESIKPGENVDLGAQVLSKSTYEQIPLLADPLAGGRQGATSKDPNLPSRYDLSENTPPVGMQGMQGSCVAWSVAYAARSYFNKVAKNVTYKASDGSLNAESAFSPAFVYNQVNNGKDNGSTISTALDLVKSAGVCTLKDMPYSEKDYITKPSAEQKQKALTYKIKSWGRVNITTNTFRRYLYFDYPIIIAAAIDNNFTGLTQKDSDGEYTWKTYSTLYGYHAMVIVGYDDNKKAFKLQNSWSDRWANKGYIWLSYDNLKAAVLEAYVMTAGDNTALQLPKVVTGTATKGTDGLATMTGIITELGSEPVIGYGVCVSTVRELPTSPFYVDGKSATSLPYSFSIAPPTTGNKLYYRAFVQTPSTTVYGDTASIQLVASTTTNSGFTITNFSTPPIPLQNKVNATVNGASIDLIYTANNPRAEIGPSTVYDFTKRLGFFTTFDFSVTKGQRIGLQLVNGVNTYSIYSIFDDKGTRASVNLPRTLMDSTVTVLPTVIDGKMHKLKIDMQSNGAFTIVSIYLDDMNTPFHKRTYSGYIPGDLTNTRVSISALSKPAGEGNYRVYNWSFTPR